MSLSVESEVSQNKGNQKFSPFQLKKKLNSTDGVVNFDINRVLIKSCRSVHGRAVADEEKKKMLQG